ncbi:hypothetical protein [Saccharopolyspora elongata]|uniref:hypothetical protein n=1 Tax=Saccharopolyspora elongata TaxID=2530387 RepID=UPI00140457FB|nr:hypothetical protein [Saccharopolyspora elongata]
MARSTRAPSADLRRGGDAPEDRASPMGPAGTNAVGKGPHSTPAFLSPRALLRQAE